MSKEATDAAKLVEIAMALRTMSAMLLNQIVQIDVLLDSMKPRLNLRDPEARNARAREVTENLLARLRRTHRTNLETSGFDRRVEKISGAQALNP